MFSSLAFHYIQDLYRLFNEVAAGLTVEQVDEWGPLAEQIAARPELAEDLPRPWFLLVSSHKD